MKMETKMYSIKQWQHVTYSLILLWLFNLVRSTNVSSSIVSSMSRSLPIRTRCSSRSNDMEDRRKLLRIFTLLCVRSHDATLIRVLKTEKEKGQ